MEMLGSSAPIQRSQPTTPGTRPRSGICSVSSQSSNSSAATAERSNPASSNPILLSVMCVRPARYARRRASSIAALLAQLDLVADLPDLLDDAHALVAVLEENRRLAGEPDAERCSRRDQVAG